MVLSAIALFTRHSWGRWSWSISLHSPARPRGAEAESTLHTLMSEDAFDPPKSSARLLGHVITCLSKDHLPCYRSIHPLGSRAQAQESGPRWCVATSADVPGSPTVTRMMNLEEGELGKPGS